MAQGYEGEWWKILLISSLYYSFLAGRKQNMLKASTLLISFYCSPNQKSWLPHKCPCKDILTYLLCISWDFTREIEEETLEFKDIIYKCLRHFWAKNPKWKKNSINGLYTILSDSWKNAFKVAAEDPQTKLLKFTKNTSLFAFFGGFWGPTNFSGHFSIVIFFKA